MPKLIYLTMSLTVCLCVLLQARLKELPQLKNLGSDGARLLQLARSTPYVICALVGHKSSAHVDENLALSQVCAFCVRCHQDARASPP